MVNDKSPEEKENIGKSETEIPNSDIQSEEEVNTSESEKSYGIDPQTPPENDQATEYDQLTVDKAAVPEERALVAAQNDITNYDSEKNKKKKKKKKKKKHHVIKNILLIILLIIIVGITSACVYTYSIISKIPEFDPAAIDDLLTESTTIYDDAGKEMETIFSGANRELVSIDKMPKNLQHAFIAIEDKTFETHHGFNIIRIFGAVKDAIFSGGRISGTSTITQQLARNAYLQDKMTERTMSRKVEEAYYALKLEQALTKDEILETYLNYIYFGYSAYGVETASRSYFSKDVSELTTAECAALAALPKAPTSYELVKFIPGGAAAEYSDVLLHETPEGIFILNDKSKDRRKLCLKLMKDQGYISEKEYKEAINVPLSDMLNPDYSIFDKSGSSYFQDYLISEVIEDLQKKYDWDYETAEKKVYQGGLQIYSTMDSQAQQVLMEEFANINNYPGIVPDYDSAGNILGATGQVILYNYDNYFDENGNYILPPGNAERLDDGSMIIYYGGDLHIYDTVLPDGTPEPSLEFKNFYTYEDDGLLYTTGGGYINIPLEFKKKDDDGNLIISSEFFKSETYKDWLKLQEDGSLIIQPAAYSLNTKMVQPQAAMTIVDNASGEIKAMLGGRNTKGKKLYNRAIEPRQPGSSIKPLGVYAPALQQSADEAERGVKHKFTDHHIDKQGGELYGDYITAASIVIDEQTTVNGKIWPLNFSRTYSGFHTVRTAVINSLNTCAVKVWYQMGMEPSIQSIKDFGISTLVEDGDSNDKNVAALALGGMTRGVTTLDMAGAFSVFPNNGFRIDPCSYSKVLDSSGATILEPDRKRHEVLDPGVAWIMGDILKSVVDSAAADPAKVPGVFCGGKTGTTDNFMDAWFDGFTPKYTGSLWIGNDYGIPLSNHSIVAAAMWGNIMRRIDASYEGSRMPMPDNVIQTSGEYFIKGTQSGLMTKNDIIQKLKICKESGCLATPSCKDVEEKEFNKFGSDKDKIPKFHCYLHNPDVEVYPIEPGKTLAPQPQDKPEKGDGKEDENNPPQAEESGENPPLPEQNPSDTQ